MKIQNISVSVEYKVSLSDVELPDKVYQQIIEAEKNGDSLSQDKYLEAFDWVTINMPEKYCYEWKADIDEIEI